jgi:hypothetical protein
MDSLKAFYLGVLRLALSQNGSSAWEFNNVVLQHGTGKCFFRTTKGYFGLATRPVERGDQIALLQGFEVPFVLRKSGQGFKVVAYGSVHGMMHGELWEEAGSSEIILY